MQDYQKNIIKSILLPVAVMMTVLFTGAAHTGKKPTGILNISSVPSGALVFVDGKMKGTTPILLEISATEHEIMLEQQGYDTYKSKITVKKDKVFRTSIALKKKTGNKAKISVKKDIQIHKPEESAEPGTVFLATTPPELTAYVDGYAISKTTPVAFDIRPGIYELVLKNEKSEVVYKKTIFVRSGKTLTLDIIIQKKRTIDYSDPWK